MLVWWLGGLCGRKGRGREGEKEGGKEVREVMEGEEGREGGKKEVREVMKERGRREKKKEKENSEGEREYIQRVAMTHNICR